MCPKVYQTPDYKAHTQQKLQKMATAADLTQMVILKDENKLNQKKEQLN